MGATRWRLAVALLAAPGLIASACADPEEPGDTSSPAPEAEVDSSDGLPYPDEGGGEPEDEPGSLTGGGVDPTLTRDDVDCSVEGLDDTGEFQFVAAHYVVDGNLGATCFGGDDPTLTQAWEILSAIVPGGQLRDLALFGGFAGTDEGDEVTLAFVNGREDVDEFQMSVNLDEAEALPDEFTLTMVHEFAHVFTALPTQIDRTMMPEDCFTYDNGEGCYLPDSVMNAWAQQFWGDELGEFDPTAEATAAAGQERCDGDAGFFGAYAASNPEEDFAESFSAWVLRVPATTAGQQERYSFMEQRPGLVEFRQRAEAAGYGPQPNNFDECGLGA